MYGICLALCHSRQEAKEGCDYPSFEGQYPADILAQHDCCTPSTPRIAFARWRHVSQAKKCAHL